METVAASATAGWHHSFVTSMRPSFAERDSYRSALSQAFADGRIEEDEFSRRSTLVETGQSADELREALADLPQPEVEFPKTVTRAEALDRSRRLQASGAPQVGRRAAIAAGAAVLGFAVAGGFGRLFGGAESSGSDDDSADSGDSVSGAGADYLTDPAARKAILKKISDKGYTQFTQMSLYDESFTAGARSLTSKRGVDSLSAYSDGQLDAEPSTHLRDGQKLFTLDDVAFDLIPAMARAAVKKLGGKAADRAEIAFGEDDLTIAVYVKGGDYGEGGGALTWTADGNQLLKITRADEG
jgi:hypothetical protein